MAKGTCSVDGCGNASWARGFCTKHYSRWLKHGDPLVVACRQYAPLTDRLWAKVNKNGPVPEHRPTLGPCWLWTGTLVGNGYGGIRAGGRMAHAHRVAYEILVAPCPAGLEPDHLCRVRHCVRPDHLEWVTHHENVLRGEAPAAINARKTHCKYGHEFTPENTYRTRAGHRGCRICMRRRSRANRARKE